MLFYLGISKDKDFCYFKKLLRQNSNITSKTYIHVSEKSLQKMMDSSSSFKDKREKHLPIRKINQIARDKSESINKLGYMIKEPTRIQAYLVFANKQSLNKKLKELDFLPTLGRKLINY